MWLFGAASALSTYGVTSIGGINFQDNAFADSLISSAGTFSVSNGSLTQVLKDKDAATYAFSHESGAFVELGFADNNLVNGFGPDLAIFELGTPDSFALSLTVGGATISYPSVATGFLADAFYPNLGVTIPTPLNVSLVDLSDFGIADGTSLDRIVIGLSIGGVVVGRQQTHPTLSLVGALNSAKVPDSGSTFAMGTIAVLGLLVTSSLLPRKQPSI